MIRKTITSSSSFNIHEPYYHVKNLLSIQDCEVIYVNSKVHAMEEGLHGERSIERFIHFELS
jgi:hypothetical protein